MRALQARHRGLAPLYTVKRLFVQRRAVKGVTPEQAAAIDGDAAARELEQRFGEALTEESFARHVAVWMDDEADATRRRSSSPRAMPPGRRCRRTGSAQASASGVLFKVPHRLDMEHLVPVETVVEHGVTMLRLPEHHRVRATASR